MEDQKRVEMLEEAAGLLSDAALLIRKAVNGSREEVHAVRDLVKVLDQFAYGGGSPNVANVPALINYFEDGGLADAA